VTSDPSDDEPSGGHLQPISLAVLTGWAVAGLVGGWLLHPVTERILGTAPVVTWVQPLVLLFMAAVVGGVAWVTWRTVHVHRQWLEPRRAVNRLLVARSCALVGALVAGGYVGYAVSWLGVDAALATQRIWRSLAAGAAGVAVVVASVYLERACRVRSGDDEP